MILQMGRLRLGEASAHLLLLARASGTGYLADCCLLRVPVPTLYIYIHPKQREAILEEL